MHISRYGYKRRNLSSETIKQLGERLIDDYKDVLKITSKSIKLKNVDTDGQWWFVEYEQIVSDIPIYGSEIGFSVDPQGYVVTLGATVHPGVSIKPVPHISPERALEVAKRRFQLDSIIVLHQPSLIILPIENDSTFTYHLSWKVQLISVQPLKNITYFIDATNGKVLRELDNVIWCNDYRIYGTVKGGYWPVRSTDNPVTTGFATTNVSLMNVLGQIWRVNTDLSGYYQFSGLSYTYYRVRIPLENMWIQVRDNGGTSGTHGALVEASYTVLPGQRDHDWGAWDGTNVFWHGRIAHDFFHGEPFNYTGMDRRINAYINSGPTINGAADGTNIYFGSQNGRPWARSSDVVYHEYTHNTIYSIYGGWIGNPNEYYTEASAMDEGLSDYFACTINNDPILGEDVGVSRNLDNNTFTWTDWQGAHWNGQVIGGAVWDFRELVGSYVADNLAFKALQIVPRARTFSDYLYNMMIADNGTYNGAYRSQLRTAFAAHGITTNEPPLPPSFGVSISGPETLPSGSVGEYTAVVYGGSGNFTYNWYVYEPNGREQYVGSGNPISIYAPYTNSSLTIQIEARVTDNSNNETSSGWLLVLVYGEGGPLSIKELILKEEINPEIPIGFSLFQNYPNPFNSNTVIYFTLPEAGMISLSVFDPLGREVATLLNEQRPAGIHKVYFDAGTLPSGVYFYRLKSSGKMAIRKMLLVR